MQTPLSSAAPDIIAGRIAVTEPAVEIAAELALEAMLAGPLGPRTERTHRNPPWSVHGFRSIRIGAERFSGSLCFREGVLQFVTLATNRPEFGTSWNDFSVEKEKARHRFHTTWLKGLLAGLEPTESTGSFQPCEVVEWTFGWGRISSGWDVKNGLAEVAVVYARPENEQGKAVR